MIQKLRTILTCILLAMPMSLSAQADMQPAMMPLNNGPGTGTAKMVAAILEYTRWPTPRSPLQICVTGQADHAGQLGGFRLSTGVAVEVQRVGEKTPLLHLQCDALYIGRVSDLAMHQLIAAVRGKSVLTIAENDPLCRSGSMFCLLFTPKNLSFQLSIDAVSRSTIRIDPRVLRLSQGAY